MLRQPALGLAAAHAQGLIHRDIKPSNLLLSKQGQVKVLDLGLARLMAEGHEPRQLTHSGQVLGTPDFMAPEQWDDTHAVDHRADLYALGCTLCFLLTGRAPFEYTNSIGMKFVLIPPGEFMMGMTKEEAEALAALSQNDENWKMWSLSSAPAHKVRLTQAFYLGTYEVTQAQYEKVAGVNPSHFSATGEGKELVKDEDPRQHPVEMISFIEAAEFCIKLSKQEQLKPVYFSANNVITLLPGDGYRLPTEAEWEWACRAGTNTTWFHGEQESAMGTVVAPTVFACWWA